MTTYKIDYSQQAQKANASSVATVESDISSSVSIENKTNSLETSGGKTASASSSTSSSRGHSPPAEVAVATTNGYFSSMSSSSYTNVTHKPPTQSGTVKPQPQTLVYSGSNNMYMKAYQQQTQQMQQHHHHSPESGYSTPVGNLMSKKLVYEVIVWWSHDHNAIQNACHVTQFFYAVLFVLIDIHTISAFLKPFFQFFQSSRFFILYMLYLLLNQWKNNLYWPLSGQSL